MNILRFALVSAALFTAPLLSRAADAEPAYLDFGKIAPSPNGQYVEVDLDQSLLRLAAIVTEKQEKDAAELIRGLKHVRVHVISLDDNNRGPAVSRIEEIRKSLSNDGWKRIVTVKQQASEDVAVFARMGEKDSIEGLAVTVIDGNNQAVVVNVVGTIRPEQISALATRFNIEPLKKIQVAASN